jgi:hypothetical protein
MEWAEIVVGDGCGTGCCSWWELSLDSDVVAKAWEGNGRGWWCFGFDLIGDEAPSLADAKDAAWAAVYRSTR